MVRAIGLRQNGLAFRFPELREGQGMLGETVSKEEAAMRRWLRGSFPRGMWFVFAVFAVTLTGGARAAIAPEVGCAAPPLGAFLWSQPAS